MTEATIAITAFIIAIACSFIGLYITQQENKAKRNKDRDAVDRWQNRGAALVGVCILLIVAAVVGLVV